MASEKNGRKAQAASCYLLYLSSGIFSPPVTASEFLTLKKSLEMRNPAPQEAKGEKSFVFIKVWCKPLVHILCDTVYSWVNPPVGDAMYSWDLENQCLFCSVATIESLHSDFFPCFQKQE